MKLVEEWTQLVLGKYEESIVPQRMVVRRMRQDNIQKYHGFYLHLPNGSSSDDSEEYVDLVLEASSLEVVMLEAAEDMVVG